MATENQLNKILSKIYVDLESLQNAREQVEKVTNSSNNLTLSTSKLAKEVKSFADIVKAELLTTISTFTKQLNQSGKSINSSFDSSSIHIKDKIIASDKYVQEKINESDKNIQVKIDKFREDVNKLRDDSKVTIAEITTISKKSLISQNQALDATIKVINNYIVKVQSLIDVLKTASIPEKLKELQKASTNLNEKLDKDKSELNQLIKNETAYSKKSIEKEIQKSTKGINIELIKTRKVVIVFGTVIIIQLCFVVYRLIAFY